jgi:hypothetical protein
MMYIPLVGWLDRLLSRGPDEIGWDDLVLGVVDELTALAHDGVRGARVFAAAIRVDLAVPERSVAVVRGFIADPRFDREVATSLANRCDVAMSDLPMRDYRVTSGARFAVTMTQQAAVPWQLTIESGDFAGRVIALPTAMTEVVFGRSDGRASADLFVCERTAFVSRRAGRLHRIAGQLEVEALDQGDQLLVRRGDGDVLRPARTARGRVAVRDGDIIELSEFSDGRGGAVRLIPRRALAETS